MNHDDDDGCGLRCPECQSENVTQDLRSSEPDGLTEIVTLACGACGLSESETVWEYDPLRSPTSDRWRQPPTPRDPATDDIDDGVAFFVDVLAHAIAANGTQSRWWFFLALALRGNRAMRLPELAIDLARLAPADVC